METTSTDLIITYLQETPEEWDKWQTEAQTYLEFFGSEYQSKVPLAEELKKVIPQKLLNSLNAYRIYELDKLTEDLAKLAFQSIDWGHIAIIVLRG